MLEAPSPLTTSYSNPATAGIDRSVEWAAGVTFEEFLPTAAENVGLWEGVYKHAVVPADVLERVKALNGNWRLLILSADWCGDASNIVPVIQRLVEAAPNLDLRLLERDDHLGLMDEHLTGGTAQAIPAVIILDQANTERAWWGPRPAELQTWVKAEGQVYSKDERYKEVRKWYARDKGRSSLDEVVTLMESATSEG